MGALYGVTIGDKHSYEDLGLYLESKTISSPMPQTKRVSVPARNGSIDMSEVVTGHPTYQDRTIDMVFYSPKQIDDWPAEISFIRNQLAGQHLKICFDDDPAFYWLGRIESVAQDIDNPVEHIHITAIVDPYKYAINSSDEDWLWDPFDFEQGIVNELYDMEVDGSLEVQIIGQRKYVNPIIISSAAMTVEYEGQTYPVRAGSQIMYDIVLTKEVDTLIFHGTGTVSINYVGGSL
ncbi:MAG: mtfA protein [Lachnospiraceae bacterium]|nr:mtfA protein [Lachnospiraceae bacterium]MBR1567557.1 mtfA protein [Lachnospiraceae bacterium]MBR1568713.1 mtfA protein [Lachnospiraceae bacterium]